MTVVAEWTGLHATTLRRALRLTNEKFAEELGTAIRTVAKWNADPALVPTPEIQRALDTMLSRSSDDARARFTLLLTYDGPVSVPPVVPGDVLQRLDSDPDLRAAANWIDDVAGKPHGTARLSVAAAVTSTGIHQRARRAASREQVASSLVAYYGSGGPHVPYGTRTEGGLLTTSVLTRPEWLDLAQPIGPDIDDLRLDGSNGQAPKQQVDEAAAVARLASALLADTRLVNGSLYRLTALTTGPRGIAGSVAVTEFVPYALTLDLMDAELTEAIARGMRTAPGELPIRDRYLPDLDSVLDVGSRLCVGGTLALTAIARPASRRRSADYVLLVQERSNRVLNATGRLAVIPKAFHGPLVDVADEAPIGASLVRELEEEVFGRQDVDSTVSSARHADPLHASRLSEPMTWLTEHPGAWRMECTGFGYNLVNGNYEFADLVLIEDEEWWVRFGGRIETNWESGALRRYSSLDRGVLDTLAHSPGWSNEGLFALLQGFRRLADFSGPRVNLPNVDLEL